MFESPNLASKLIGAEDYARRYLVDMAFEDHLIRARQDECLAFLADYRPDSVLEVGCGPDLLIDRFDLEGSAIRRWMVVEPSFYADAIGARMAGSAALGGKLGLTRGYLEDRVDALLADQPEGFGAVMLSGLLHETADPAAMLAAAFRLTRNGGRLFVSVPNAHSFHRLLGVEMGLMAATTQLSPRNIELGQPVVFHRDTLERLVGDAGFVPGRFSGYMFKPFANGQMAAVVALIGAEVVDGLDRLGKAFPDHAAEIALVARKPA